MDILTNWSRVRRTVTSREWARLHPIRWKRHQATYRWKKRKPCRLCGEKLNGFCKGRQYHVLCQGVVRRTNRNKRNALRLRGLALYKLRRGCKKCGYKKIAAALDFHHVKPALKLRRVLYAGDKEIQKCVILCANCHREETWKAKHF